VICFAEGDFGGGVDAHSCLDVYEYLIRVIKFSFIQGISQAIMTRKLRNVLHRNSSPEKNETIKQGENAAN
jgi:hypothetical protein